MVALTRASSVPLQCDFMVHHELLQYSNTLQLFGLLHRIQHHKIDRGCLDLPRPFCSFVLPMHLACWSLTGIPEVSIAINEWTQSSMTSTPYGGRSGTGSGAMSTCRQRHVCPHLAAGSDECDGPNVTQTAPITRGNGPLLPCG